MQTAWLPKSVTALRGYTRSQFWADLQASHQGIRFLIAGIHAQPLVALQRAGKLDEYGRQNFVATLDEALEIARTAAGDIGKP